MTVLCKRRPTVKQILWLLNLCAVCPNNFDNFQFYKQQKKPRAFISSLVTSEIKKKFSEVHTMETELISLNISHSKAKHKYVNYLMIQPTSQLQV